MKQELKMRQTTMNIEYKYFIYCLLIEFDLSLFLSFQGDEERQEADDCREERVLSDRDVNINCSNHDTSQNKSYMIDYKLERK